MPLYSLTNPDGSIIQISPNYYVLARQVPHHPGSHIHEITPPKHQRRTLRQKLTSLLLEGTYR